MNYSKSKPFIPQIKKLFRQVGGIGTRVKTLEGGGGIKRYKALLTQSGTDAPTAVILENTLGEVPTFSYSASGEYKMTSNGKFTGKTFLIIGSATDGDPSGLSQDVDAFVYSINEIIFISRDTIDDPTNGLLENTSILIEVYP